MLIDTEHHITARKIRSTRRIESRAVKGNASTTIGPARNLRTQNVVQVCRRLNIKIIIISRRDRVVFIKLLDVTAKLPVCFFHGRNSVFKKPYRKLALDRTPHALHAAFSFRRPRQDLMDVQVVTDPLPLGPLFLHSFEFFPLRKLRPLWSITKDSSTIRVNLARNTEGTTGLPQDFQVPIKAFILGKIQAGNFTRSVVNATGQTIALIIPRFVEPSVRSTIHLHKVTFTIATKPRPMYRSRLFLFVSFGRHQAVLVHNFTQRDKRDFYTFELFQAPTEIRKIDVRIMTGIQKSNALGQSRVNFVFRDARRIPMLKHRLAQVSVFLFEATQMVNRIPGRLGSLAQGILAIIKTPDVNRQQGLDLNFF